jgi:hypothetical protein
VGSEMCIRDRLKSLALKSRRDLILSLNKYFLVF